MADEITKPSTPSTPKLRRFRHREWLDADVIKSVESNPHNDVFTLTLACGMTILKPLEWINAHRCKPSMYFVRYHTGAEAAITGDILQLQYEEE